MTDKSNDLEIEVEHSGNDEDGSEGAVNRTPVRVKGRYGTTLYKPEKHSECESCRSRSDGVVMVNKGGLATGVAVCDDCVEKLKRKIEHSHRDEALIYKRFEDA